MGVLSKLGSFFGLGGESAHPKPSAAIHEAASTGGRLRSWNPGNENAGTIIFRDAELLRSRSRDMSRRNAWAFNAVDTLVSNLVGTGIKPRSSHESADFKERAHALWQRWTRQADANGVQGFYGLQALAVRAMVEGGEVLVRLRNREPRDGLVVPLQLQLLEPEHLPVTLNRDLPGGNVIRAGIEFDQIGRRVAYHLYREHPGDKLSSSQFNGEPVRVPASEILHLYRQMRPGQHRGEPWLTQALVKLHELDQYDDAELVRKKTAALIAGFIRQPAADFALNDDPKSTRPELSWTPGTMQVLLPGEDITFSEPADVGGQYAVFMQIQLRAVAMAIGVTYEQITGDLTGVNYSSIRAGMVEFRRRIEQWQRHTIIHQFCFPVWERWLDQAVLSGALVAPGYSKSRADYQDVKWIPQGWAWVDPQKDITSIIMAIRAGLVSRDQAVATYGYDAEEIDREMAASNQRADDAGLILDTDPRKRTRTGAAVTDNQQPRSGGV